MDRSGLELLEVLDYELVLVQTGQGQRSEVRAGRSEDQDYESNTDESDSFSLVQVHQSPGSRHINTSVLY